MSDKPIHMTGKEYYDLLQKTRREALEEACKAMCEDCKDEDPHLELVKGEWQHHIIGEYGEYAGKDFGYLLCDANEIRKLMATDQEKGQGQTTQAEPVERYEGELGTLEHLIWLDEKIAKAVEKIGTKED